MNRNIILSVLLITVVAFGSCFKEDEIVKLPPQGDVIRGKVALGENYENQIFFDIATNKIISTNLKTDWDLSFEAASDSFNIYLNYSKKMYAGTSKETSFDKVTSSSGITLKFDDITGNPDSAAFVDWYYEKDGTYASNEYVYVVNRGLGLNGEDLGKKKIIVQIENGNYKLHYANLDGSDDKELIVKKNNDYHYMYFSFDNGIVDIAPKKTDWNLQFTRYVTILPTDDGGTIEYLVTGILTNPYNVEVAEDTISFEDIELEDVENYNFSKDFDVIGYDWKIFLDGEYTIDINKSFIIKNNDGFYYKLRFIDFYDENGIKGTPTFEIVKL